MRVSWPVETGTSRERVPFKFNDPSFVHSRFFCLPPTKILMMVATVSRSIFRVFLCIEREVVKVSNPSQPCSVTHFGSVSFYVVSSIDKS